MSINTSTLPITLPPNLARDQLLSHPPFTSWLSTLSHSLSLQSNPKHSFHDSPYSLHSLNVQSVDFFGSRIGFLKFSAHIENPSGEKIPGTVFLRGGSVAILLILEGEEGGDEWVVLTVQPRIPAASLEFVELPAGMLDDSTFSGAAAKEIQEECGIEIPADKLLDLTQLALGKFVDGGDEKLQTAVYPSPGGCDEFMKLFAYRHRIDKGTLKDWKGRLTGLREHGEKITLKVVRLCDLWKETVDAKALSAVALWDGLKRDGKI
ncbi:hypothetical protein K440DRAFT_626687 [Wilcoxina mikolae CBS 423.85]|nr:hypothetical protein K440DRAFT_626687 [Wilcoxina mikolae CBS 423.85]